MIRANGIRFATRCSIKRALQWALDNASIRCSQTAVATSIDPSRSSPEILNSQYHPTVSFIHFNPNGDYESFRFNKRHNEITIPKSLHSQFMDKTPMDILQSLVLWSMHSNPRNITNLHYSTSEIFHYLETIGFLKLCPPSIWTSYYSSTSSSKLDDKLSSPQSTHHQQLNFVTTRSLQIFEFLHWRLLNNNTASHIGGVAPMRKKVNHQNRYRSQLQVDPQSVASMDGFKTLRYLRIDALYLSLYDIALHEIGSVPLSFSVLQSWIEHGFHLFIAANPGHLQINNASNPLHEMYVNAMYHILSDRPRFVDVPKEYGKRLLIRNNESMSTASSSDTFVFTMLFRHILEHFGIGNVSAILKKVFLRCLLFDRQRHRDSREQSKSLQNADSADSHHTNLKEELCVFEDKKLYRAFKDVFSVYGKQWNHEIRDRLLCITMRYMASVGEIDAVRFLYNQANKTDSFAIRNSYNMIKLCEALNSFISEGLTLSTGTTELDKEDEEISFMHHSDPLSGHNEPTQYFQIRVQQTIDLLAKMMVDRDQMLLSMAKTSSDIPFESASNRVHQMADGERIKLEKCTANCGLDISSVTHRIIYCMNQLQLAIQEFEMATNQFLEFQYPEKLVHSLAIIERVHHKYPLSNDWHQLKLSEQKQMFLDIANGIRSGVLILKMSQQNQQNVSDRRKSVGTPGGTPHKVLELRLWNHYNALWHTFQFTDVLASVMVLSEVPFNTFLQSLSIDMLPHAHYRMATFFRICSLFLRRNSLKGELTKKDVLTMCSKLVNILQYAVGEEKSTNYDYFLLNVKLLILSIHSPYPSNLSDPKLSSLELKCLFTHSVYTMMIDSELIQQNKHFVPDLELSEMILFLWFQYFVHHFRSGNGLKLSNHSINSKSAMFHEMFVAQNWMSDLLEYSISMKVFDGVASHPLIFHLTIFSKLISLIQHENDEREDPFDREAAREVIDLWRSTKRFITGNVDDYYGPIEEAMGGIISELERGQLISGERLDPIIRHLEETWSPYFVEFEKEKRAKRREKRNKRWRELIEPQLMSVLAPRDLRFLVNDNRGDEQSQIFEPLMISKWFSGGDAEESMDGLNGDALTVDSQDAVALEEQKWREIRSRSLELRRSEQGQFEEFVNSLNVEYLSHLVSYQKFVKSKGLEGTLGVNEYIANLNEEGVYVDPGMGAFITSIEPLVQKMKKRKQSGLDEDTILEDAEARSFVMELESMYDALMVQQAKINKKRKKKQAAALRKDGAHQMDIRLKRQFMEEMNNLLRDRPKLQEFLDAVQEVIQRNKMSLQKRRYSLMGNYSVPSTRYVDDETVMEFENWTDFQFNVEHSGSAMESKEHVLHLKYLEDAARDSKALLEKSTERMVGDLDYYQIQKFLESVETLPIKSNMTQESYALSKLVKELDEMY